MSLILYGAIFWISAVIAIGLSIYPATKNKTKSISVIKMIPGLSAVGTIILLRPSDSLFYLLLAGALLFCAFGDFGIEYQLIIGLGLFLISHIFYIVTFLWQSLLMGFDMIPLLFFAACTIAMILYVVFYQRYLKTTEKEVPPAMLNAVIVYAMAISLTLSTSLLLWLTTGETLGFLPFVGALSFILSDSLIGIREFHHDFSHERLIILTTYYLAIFLLSLSVFIYLF